MKRIIGIGLAVLAIGCNGIIGNGYTVTGEVNGLKDGTKVFLQKLDETTNMPINIDTVKLEKGKFVFEGETKEPQAHFMSFENAQGAIFFILEKGNIKAVINKDSIGMAKLSGTYNNDELSSLSKKLMAIQKKTQDFQTKNIDAMKMAQSKNDTATVNKLNKEFGKIQEEYVDANKKYIQENPKSFISLLVFPNIVNSPNSDTKEIKKIYDSLDSSIKETSSGKRVSKQLDDFIKSVDSKKKVS